MHDPAATPPGRVGIERLGVRYAGRVQGVGFRATAQAIASRHPRVTGFVRNERDGSVHLEAQGEPGPLEAFLDSVSHAMQRRIDTEERAAISLVEGEAAFRIAR